MQVGFVQLSRKFHEIIYKKLLKKFWVGQERRYVIKCFTIVNTKCLKLSKVHPISCNESVVDPVSKQRDLWASKC